MLETKTLSQVQKTYKCKYCQKDFSKESTLMTHVCEKKRRKLSESEKQNRIAYQSWLVYRRLSLHAKNDKPYDEFIINRYFTDFMKLAKFMIDLNMDRPEDYVKYVILNGVKIFKWTTAATFEAYVKERTKKETVERAIERSLINMKAWAERTNNNWQDYFVRVNTIDAVHDIRMGRISPWCTFSTDQGSRLIDRLEPGQIEALIEYMDPQSWRVKVKRQHEDAQWVQDVFNKAEIS